MKLITRAALTLLSLALLSSPAKASDEPGWAALPDPAAQVFEDPYAALNADQLTAVVTAGRLREQLEQPTVPPAKRQQLEQRRTDLEAGLTADGLDIDWLLNQRWTVAARRQHAATAANPDLDGTTVSLKGYAIPALPAADGMPTAYLVARRGLCSHMPPPPPNQLIRVRLDGEWTAQSLYEPVRMTGTLVIDPSLHSVRIVDGDVPMQATWRLDAKAIEPLGKPVSATGLAHQTDLHVHEPSDR